MAVGIWENSRRRLFASGNIRLIEQISFIFSHFSSQPHLRRSLSPKQRTTSPLSPTRLACPPRRSSHCSSISSPKHRPVLSAAAPLQPAASTSTRMNITTDRSWMYKRRVDGFLSNAFVVGVESFIQFALTRPSTERDGDKMKCPCRRTKCCNRAYRSIDEIKFHLCSKGFVPDYLIWSHHGETNLVLSQCNVEVGGSSSDIRENSPNNYVNTVQDAAELEFEVTDDSEAPTAAYKLQLTPHQRPDETVTKPILTDLQARQSQSQESRTPDDVYPTTVVRHKKGRRFSTGALIKEYNCGVGSSSEMAEVRRLKRELQEAEMRHQDEVYMLMRESLEAKKRHLEEVYTLREEMEEARQREWLKILEQIQQQADAAVAAAMARQAGQANPPPPPPPSTNQ